MPYPDFDPSTLEITEIYQKLETSSSGLTQTQAQERLKLYGPNEITQKKATSPWLIFLKQFKSFLILILFLAGFISLLLNHKLDAYIIFTVILANSLIGFLFEFRAEKSIEALKHILKNKAKLLRDKELTEVLTRELVVGDLLVLEEGDKIAADCRLIEAKNLYLMESAITGESLEVAKNPVVIEPTNSLGDKTNMLFTGTLVQKGQAKAIVTSTADNTELGKIASQLSGIKNVPSNFEKKSAFLARQLAIGAIIVSSFIFIVGFFWQKMAFIEIFLLTTAVLVSAIPEGLPAIVAISLAVGAKKMSENKAIIRNLSSAETVGSLTVICTDKTGTLTENKMSAEAIYLPTVGVLSPDQKSFKIQGHDKIVDQDSALQELLLACDKGNKAVLASPENPEQKNVGDQTELALKKMVANSEFKFNNYELVEHLAFTSDNKFQATLIKNPKEQKILVTGAPEVLLSLSQTVGYSQEKLELSAYLDKINEQISKFNQQGYRTIGVASQDNPGLSTLEVEDITNLTFLGLIAVKDPVRKGVKNSVAESFGAGVQVKMLTGDHKETATSIAKDIGLIKDGEDISKLVFTDSELKAMSGQEFDKVVMEAKVFARLNPLTKLEITKSLQKQGELVAMTGDGVNDAPALKQADLGISMGITGTDVARETSDIVLADDNFNTIVLALRQGRVIFENIRKASYFLLSTNLAEVATILGAMLLGLASPLSSVQILWLNLVTDGVNGAALSMEKGDKSIMFKKPNPVSENLLNHQVLPYLLVMVLVMAPLTLFSYYQFLPQGVKVASSSAFLVMSLTQLFNLINLKNLRKSSLNTHVLDNPWLNATTLFSFALIIFGPYTFIGSFLGLVPLAWHEVGYLFLLSSLVLWVMEVYKLVHNKLKPIKIQAD